MREFRKKQKRMKKIMNTLVIAAVVYIFIYYGIEPTLAKALSQVAMAAVLAVMYILVVASMAVLFYYTSKYGKSDKFLEAVEYELSDTGYYFTSRKERDISAYSDAVTADLLSSGFKINTNTTINDIDFDVAAYKGSSIFYIVNEPQLEKTDIIAHIDSAIYDITSINVKRKGNSVITFICDNAEEAAISISKVITPLGKKEQIKIAVAVVELSTGRVYFLGNKPSKCQALIANYAMNCDLPLKQQYIGTERLPFQDELEEHMKDFNIKDFKNGEFFAH